MTEVIMPKMGDGMEEGTLLEWLKKDGESVKSGEIIGTIQTDKATLELESPGTGTLTGFLVGPEGTVPVGRPIAAILKDGEKLPAGWGSGGDAAPAKTQPAEPVAAAAPVPTAPSRPEPAPTSTGRVKASPLAKRIAAEAGVDLHSLTGTGPGGRIVEKDVRAAIAGGTKLPSMSPNVTAVVATKEDKVVKLGRLRQITAQRTTQSKQQVPHFYVKLEVNLDKIHAVREAFKEEEGGKISVNDFVIRACALALREMPVVNSTYQGDHLLQYGTVNVGMAVALDEGLTVPVIKNADNMTLRQISAASRDLATKARDNKLSPDELGGSTFSVSNMGMLDVDEFTAIINAPNAAIVAIGTAKRIPIITEDDEVVAQWTMNITGSFDHRVVDGAVGARFMNKVREYLENPTRLLS